MPARPDQFQNAARTARGVRNRVAQDKAHLRALGGAFEGWMSPASEHFGTHQFRGSLQQYDLVLRDLDALVHILNGLEDQLEQKLRQIRNIEGKIRAWYANPPAWTIDEEDPRPIWERQGWRYQPYNLPAGGSPAWFTVDNHFRSVYGISL